MLRIGDTEDTETRVIEVMEDMDMTIMQTDAVPIGVSDILVGTTGGDVIGTDAAIGMEDAIDATETMTEIIEAEGIIETEDEIIEAGEMAEIIEAEEIMVVDTEADIASEAVAADITEEVDTAVAAASMVAANTAVASMVEAKEAENNRIQWQTRNSQK